MFEILKKASRRVREKGFWDTARWARFRLGEEHGEWRVGVRTKGEVKREDLGLYPSCFDYQPAHYRWIRAAFRHMRVKPSDVLLDYGAGKGRVIAAASQRPFRKIIGVEISPELSAIAEENVATAKRRVCEDVQLVTVDAADYVPPDDVTAVFLFNPFGPPIIDRVGDRLCASVHARPRRLTLFYSYAIHEGNFLAGWDWVTRTTELATGVEDDVRMLVYTHDPETSDG